MRGATCRADREGVTSTCGQDHTHEDHGQRAVRAGLAIQVALGEYQQELRESRGIDFRVRIGLNSGPVVVSRVDYDLTMDYLAIGDPVNLAARMQTLAEPGSVLISENTHRLVEGYFVMRNLGAREVKGKSDPITVYEAHVIVDRSYRDLLERMPAIQSKILVSLAARGSTRRRLRSTGAGACPRLYDPAQRDPE